MGTPRTAIDLFAGAGGATQGLRQAGYDVLAALEIDEAAASTYRANHKAVALLTADIQEIDPHLLMDDLSMAPGQLDLLQACPPCQAWSSLGTGDAGDPRNELVLQVRRFLEVFRPRSFVLENVPGLRRDRRLAELLGWATEAGYVHRSYLLDAEDFGIAQRRRRLIVLGVHAVSPSALPEHPAELLPESFDATPRTVADAFVDLRGAPSPDPLARHRNHSESVLRRIRAIPEGGTRHDLPGDLVLECHQKLGRSGATSSYGRLARSRPAPTLTTRCTTPACGPFVHPTEHRGITLREAALLQSFPAAYAFTGTYGQIERQIGNAIPVRLAEAIGLAAWAVREHHRATA